MKKFVAMLSAAALCLSLLAGCGGGAGSAPGTPSTPAGSTGGQASGEKIPIRFMYWNKEEIMQALIDLINE